MRGPFQGVSNIVRFNWPFYMLSVSALITLSFVYFFSTGILSMLAGIFLVMTAFATFSSLFVSWYIYDLSELYSLNWLGDVGAGDIAIVNINAGFDETSVLLSERYKGAELIVYDFFDPLKHTEPSIRRARRAYPPYPSTQPVSINHIPLQNDSVDSIFAIMSAHEIRDSKERVEFFAQLERILSPDGNLIVVEHLRDTANLMAYNIGAFHFHSRATWKSTFEAASLNIRKEVRITPFVTAFFLGKNGTTS
ncbi:MAG: class I SAM-dependent methyltransferase [Pyrinomonadaceae bacterium]